MLPRIPLGTARPRDEPPYQVTCPTSALRARPLPADPESVGRHIEIAHRRAYHRDRVRHHTQAALVFV